MSCEPYHLLELAERLGEDSEASEVQLRCAVSRAYYAALHSVFCVFPKLEDDVRIDGESSHAEIIGRVKKYGNSLQPGRTAAASVAKKLPRLRRERNTADYDLEEEIAREAVLEIIERVTGGLHGCEEVIRLREAAERNVG